MRDKCVHFSPTVRLLGLLQWHLNDLRESQFALLTAAGPRRPCTDFPLSCDSSQNSDLIQLKAIID